MHWWARERLGLEEAEEMAISTLRMIAHAVDSLQSHKLSTDQQAMQHISVCDSLCKKKVAWGARYEMGGFGEEWCSFAGMFQYHGRNQEGADMWQRALAGYEKALEPDHPDTSRVLFNLGSCYAGQGRFAEAEEALSRALSGYQQFQQGHERDLCDTQYLLGEVFEQCGRLAEADSAFSEAWRGYKDLLGPDDQKTVDAAGRVERVRGKQEQAV